jgi:hypothetical protein
MTTIFENSVEKNIRKVNETCGPCLKNNASPVCKRTLELNNTLGDSKDTFSITCMEAVKAFQIPEETLAKEDIEARF